MPDFSFDALRRYPDVPAENLFASDASDRLILDEAARDLASVGTREVAVIGDTFGALAHCRWVAPTWVKDKWPVYCAYKN